jgi:hypothetical protein
MVARQRSYSTESRKIADPENEEVKFQNVATYEPSRNNQKITSKSTGTKYEPTVFSI